MVNYNLPSQDNYQRYKVPSTFNWMILNDSSTNSIDVSFNGSDKAFTVFPNEQFEFLYDEHEFIYIKSTVSSNSANFRLIAWGDKSIFTSIDESKPISNQVQQIFTKILKVQ